MQSISANLNIMIKAAEKASRALIRDFGEIEKLQVSTKGPTDFVSNADLKAEKISIEELKKARPYYSIISEEDGSEINKDKNNTWIIDPIDGTTNFLHGVPHFAISIALRSGDEIVSGLIYDPIKDEMFYAEKASRALIRDFGEVEKLQVSIKGPTDFVSNADLKAEKIIIEELKKARPYYSIISEEEGSEINKDKNNTWIIDPIDGTTNFLHGVPHFAISIALRSGDEIVSGLIYDPIKDEMFYAEKDNGAFFNNQRIRVSKKRELNSCLFATGGLLKKEIDLPLRNSGSAALDVAYVAAGRYDGYFQNDLNLWDIAAGIIMIKEAGGMINEIDLTQNKNLQIRASSMAINDKMLDKLKNF